MDAALFKKLLEVVNALSVQCFQNCLAFIGEPRTADRAAVFRKVEVVKRVEQQVLQAVVRHKCFEFIPMVIERMQLQYIAQSSCCCCRIATATEPLLQEHAQFGTSHARRITRCVYSAG